MAEGYGFPVSVNCSMPTGIEIVPSFGFPLKS